MSVFLLQHLVANVQRSVRRRSTSPRREKNVATMNKKQRSKRIGSHEKEGAKELHLVDQDTTPDGQHGQVENDEQTASKCHMHSDILYVGWRVHSHQPPRLL